MIIKDKIIKTFLIAVFVIVLITPLSVFAAAKAGLTPASPFYFLDIFSEKISLFFTFSPDKKAQKALNNAEERLAEVEVVANGNKPKAITTAMASYQENISLAITESKKIKDEEKKESILSVIADNTSKHQEALTEAYNKAPDGVKESVEKAIEISIKSRDGALKEIQTLKKTVEELQKDIELLKQQGQSDQDKEIEVLREEIEKLKSQQSSSAKSQGAEKVVEKIVEVPPVTSQKPATKLSNSEIIEKVKYAVVYIQTSDSSGSGMIIESNGYILTNAHVVSSVNTVKIKLSDGRLFIGSVIGRDEKIDLALLKINGENFPTVILGDSSADVLKQGDEVFAFGYPFGLEGDVSFKEGTISRRQTYEGITYLETSAQIHPGNSGGPLVNRFAQVIGVNTQAVGTGVSGVLVGESIKFALPINLVRGLIPELKSGRNVVLPKIISPTLPSLPTPIPNPTPTPSPVPTPEPIPTPIPQPIKTTISNIKVSVDIGITNAVAIYWDVNKVFADSKVLYGINSDLSGAETIKTSLRSVNIYNLKPDTTYYYQIIVKDTDTGLYRDPEEAKSDILSFIKRVKPTIISVDVSYPFSTTAVILVKTDIESYSNLEYKKSDDTVYEKCGGSAIRGFTNCDSITGATGKKTEHSFTITNLNPEVDYEYYIKVYSGVYSQPGYIKDADSDFRTGIFKTLTP